MNIKKINIIGSNTVKQIRKDTQRENTKIYEIPDSVYEDYKKQHSFLCSLYVTDTCPYKTEIIKELKYKLSSYMGQDKKHGFYDKAKCLDIQGIIELLVSSKLKCNYCKGSVFLLYKEIRQGNQWTLDRIDNTQGHNVGNCEIACYTCNVQKKQMDDKKFRFTKQMRIIKKD